MKLSSKLAKDLLGFLKQNEDFETKIVLKSLICDLLPSAETSSSAPAKKPSITALKKPSFEEKPVLQPKTIASQTQEVIKPQSLSIFTKLADKVKKACPELRIKDQTQIKKAGIPDCDVVLLSEKVIPDVYLSLTKAIDKQFALTESVVMNDDLMPDLLTKHYKLILAPPFIKKMKHFMSHIKDSRIGSSLVIFIDESEELSKTPAKKQQLWQMIKQALS